MPRFVKHIDAGPARLTGNATLLLCVWAEPEKARSRLRESLDLVTNEQPQETNQAVERLFEAHSVTLNTSLQQIRTYLCGLFKRQQATVYLAHPHTWWTTVWFEADDYLDKELERWWGQWTSLHHAPPPSVLCPVTSSPVVLAGSITYLAIKVLEISGILQERERERER